METTMPGVNTPSTTNIVDLTNFGGSFAVPKPVPTNYNSFIQSLQTELPNLQNEVNTYQTALDKQLSDLMSTNQDIGNKGTYQLEQENKLGINNMTKELADINKQFAQKKADYMSQYQTVGEKVSDKAFVTGMQAELQNRSAIELGNLASVQQALQGNIQLARDTASRATELKYAPIEASLKNKLLFYDYNKDRLTSAQKRLADKQAQSYELQLKNIEQIKSDARSLQNNVLDLLKDGKIDVNSAQSIMSGKTTLFDAFRGSGQNVAMSTTNPVESLTMIIKNGGAKTDDKLKLTGAVIAAAQDMASKNPTGDFSGLGPIRAGNLTVGSKGQSNRTYLSALRGTVESWMTGASVSEDQQKRIEKDLIPKESDTDRQVRQKINALTNYMMSYAKGNLATQGINFNPPEIDLFTVQQDPLNLQIDTVGLDPLGLN